MNFNVRKYLLQTFLITAIAICPFTKALAVDSSTKHETREKMLNLFAGEWISRGIYVVTKLGIADYLEDGPKTSTELARLSCSNKESLSRLLHMLAGYGIFEELDGSLYKNTELSSLLSKKNSDSLASLCEFYGEDMHRAFESLLPSIQSGKSGFEIEFQKPVFAFFKENPERALLFQKAMKDKSNAVIDATLAAYDFSHLRSVYDIGGGFGQFVSALTQKHPNLSGVVYELGEVTEKIKELQNANPHISVVSGDFFKSIPEGGEAYLLKSIIHDWNDEKAQEILCNCHKAMKKDSKLLIVDVVLKPKNLSTYANCMDILMLTITGGKERSLKCFEKLLDQSGFVLENVYSTKTEFSILEAKKK